MGNRMAIRVRSSEGRSDHDLVSSSGTSLMKMFYSCVLVQAWTALRPWTSYYKNQNTSNDHEKLSNTLRGSSVGLVLCSSGLLCGLVLYMAPQI